MTPTRSRLALLGLCAILLLMCVLRLPSLVAPIWSVDDGTHAIIANKILEGGLPYRDAVDHRAPLPWYVCALTFLFTGPNNMNALRIVLVGLSGIIIVFIFLIGRLTVGDKGALFAALLFTIISSVGLDRIGYAFEPEWCLAVFTCLGSYLFLRGRLFGHSRILSFLSGLSYGLAFFSKQPAIMDFLAPLSFLVYQEATKKTLPGVNKFRSSVDCALLLLLGFLTVCVLFFAYFYAKGAWEDFVFYFWTYNNEYFIPARPLLKTILMVPMWFLQVSTPMNLGVWVLTGLMIMFLNSAGSRENEENFRVNVKPYLVIWSVTSFLATIVAGRNYYHYTIQLLPPWCLLSGLTFKTLFEFLTTIQSAPQGWLRKISLPALLTFLVLLVVIPALALTCQMAKIVRDVSRTQPTELIEWITSHSQENEKIFVWGFSPHLYTLANRTPASRYPYYHFQSGFICWVRENRIVPGTMEILLKELHLNRPRIIVDQFAGITHNSYYEMPMRDFPDLWNFVCENYVFREQFNEGGVWQLREAIQRKGEAKSRGRD